MRIGIDARPIMTGGVGRGFSVYAANLIEALLHTDQRNTYCLFIARDQPIPALLKQISASSSYEIVRLHRPTRNIFFWDQVLWASLLTTRRIDVFHSLVYGVPLRCPCPKILTVHDVTPLVFPEFVRRLRHKVIFRFNFFTGRFADRVITSSAHSKRDLTRHAHIPSHNITVILDGVTARYRPVNHPDALHALRARFHLPEKFLLYVGGFDHNKNLPVLVQAFRRLLQEPPWQESDLRLVFVGKLTPAAQSVRKIVQRYALEQRVMFTDFVPEEDLILLYNAAELFVFPSLYEGFGLPPLEALACGTPCVVSQAASLPEVVGDAALLFNPHSVEELSQAMHTALTDQTLRARLRQRGLERAKTLSWTHTAQHTRQVYTEVRASSSETAIHR